MKKEIVIDIQSGSYIHHILPVAGGSHVTFLENKMTTAVSVGDGIRQADPARGERSMRFEDRRNVN
jgi:hypothetical protein